MSRFNLYYEDEYTGKIQWEFDGEMDLDETIDKMKRFLIAIGFHTNSVNDIKNYDEDNTILIDRIKSAIDALDTNAIEDAKKYLNDALM